MKIINRRTVLLRKITIIIFITIITFIKIIPTLALEEATSSAQEVNIGYSRINPTSPFYFLKTIRENLEFKLALTPRVRILRQLEFATRRLREARTLVNLKKEDLVPATLERYASYLNIPVDKKSSDSEILTKVKEEFTSHLQVLKQMYNQSNLRSKMAIRLTMYRIIQRTDLPVEVNKSICNLFAKESSSSALNQTEQVVLASRAKSCFQAITVDKSARIF